MKLARRRFVIGALAGSSGALALTAGSPIVRASQFRGLLIFDSRLHGSDELVAAAADLFPERIDLAQLDDRGWFALRSRDLGDLDGVSGCTAWQDFVVLRDLLRQRRLRLALPETRVDAADGHSVFLWRMA